MMKLGMVYFVCDECGLSVIQCHEQANPSWNGRKRCLIEIRDLVNHEETERGKSTLKARLTEGQSAQ